MYYVTRGDGEPMGDAQGFVCKDVPDMVGVVLPELEGLLAIVEDGIESKNPGVRVTVTMPIVEKVFYTVEELKEWVLETGRV